MKPKIVVALATSVALSMLPALSQPAGASVLTVTTNLDVVDGSDGLLSVREAVIAANAAPGADEIRVAGTTYDLTVCDSIASEENAAASGDLDLTDPAGATVRGVGSTTVVRQMCAGEDRERIFDALGGPAAFNDLRLTGGRAQNGSALRAVGNLTLDSAAVVGNDTTGIDPLAGSPVLTAIYVSGPNLTMSITDSSVSDNVGGAIHDEGVGGTVSIERSHLDDNVGPEVSAVQTRSRSLLLRDSTVRRNVFNRPADNRPFPPAGPATINVPTATIERSEISDNSVGDYDYASPGCQCSRLTMSDSVVRDNEGQLPALFGSDLLLERSTVSGTKEKPHAIWGEIGGQGVWSAKATIRESTISDNSGGGIGTSSASDANVVIERSTISHNGGPALEASRNVTIDRSTISGNQGGVHLTFCCTSSTQKVVTNSAIVDNTASVGGHHRADITAIRAVGADGALALQRSAVGSGPAAGPSCTIQDASPDGKGPLVEAAYSVTTDDSCSVSPSDGNLPDAGDLRLGALGDHGGPTPTRLPDATSPVLDTLPTADPACTGTDQRGAAVPQGPGCDSGPVELGTGALVSVQPFRVLDTRNGTGIEGPVGERQTRSLQLVDASPASPASPPFASGASIRPMASPVPASATAVVMNLTVTGGTASSHLTVWPSGRTKPVASNENWSPGETRANMVKIALGANGAVDLFNNSGTVDVIADIVGWYGPEIDMANRFVGTTPTRILDTRSDLGLAGQFGPQQTRSLTVPGPASPVPDDADAILVNVTAVNSTADSHLTVWPEGQPMPVASSLNWPAGKTVPNLVLAKLGPDGRIQVFNNEGMVDVIADVVGYFQRLPGANFVGATPTRILDTRTDLGLADAFGPLQTRVLTVTGPAAPLAPPGATAVVLNMTITDATASSHLTVWPDGLAKPIASSLNWAPGDTVPNLVVVPVGANGAIDLANNSGNVHVIADLVGWYR